jgi:hypothetical protein
VEIAGEGVAVLNGLLSAALVVGGLFAILWLLSVILPDEKPAQQSGPTKNSGTGGALSPERESPTRPAGGRDAADHPDTAGTSAAAVARRASVAGGDASPRLIVEYVLDAVGRPVSSQDPDAWMRARAEGITATDARRLVRLDGRPKVGKQRMPHEKLQQQASGISIESGFQSAAMLDGVEREPLVAELLGCQFGVQHNRYLVRGADPRHLATPDGFGDDFVVEIKSSCRPFDEVLRMHRDQVQWQLHVTRARRAMFAVEDRETRETSYAWVARDETRIGELVIHANDVLRELDRLRGARSHRLGSDRPASAPQTSQASVPTAKSGPVTPVLRSAASRTDAALRVTQPDVADWVHDDSVALLRQYVDGSCLDEMARFFEVSTSAVVTELASWMLDTIEPLRDESAPRYGAAWTADDVQALRERYGPLADVASIAASLRRDQLGVSCKLFELHLPAPPRV